MDLLLDDAPCGFLAFTDEGTITAVNRTLAVRLGYTREDLVGLHVERLLTVAGRIFYQTHFFPLLKLHGKAEEIFFTLRCRDGELVPVLTNALRKQEGGAVLNHCVLLPIPERRKYEDEILAARHKAEEAVRSSEELIQTRANLETYAQELDRKVRRLEQKNAELTRVSTILSHDLREPVRKLSVFAGLLGEGHSDGHEMGGRAVDVIRAQCVRLDALVRGLHEYVSLNESPDGMGPVDLGSVLTTAITAVTDRYGAGALTVTAGPLPTVDGARPQLELLFVQLLDNAVKFARPGVPPHVRVSCREVQSNRFRASDARYSYVPHALMVFEDNGIGFDARYSSYVFEALRKLDPGTPGLGLGLASCWKIAENHYGEIRAESTQGHGSRFTVLLPLRH